MCPRSINLEGFREAESSDQGDGSLTPVRVLGNEAPALRTGGAGAYPTCSVLHSPLVVLDTETGQKSRVLTGYQMVKDVRHLARPVRTGREGREPRYDLGFAF